jgi:nitroreductase
MKKLLSRIRSYGRLLKALNGFIYDFKRYYLYSAWKADMNDIDLRNYHAVKVYHSLEKSMSFENRKEGSGWNSAFVLLDILKIAKETGEIGYHDKAGRRVLNKFIGLDENKNTPQCGHIKAELLNLDFDSLEDHGSKEYSAEEFNNGVLTSPESFFFSRYSLREFRTDYVDEELVMRAVSLAMKSPSVCHRQAWHVYHTMESSLIQKVLKYQSGNRGFGERVPNLMIVTTDMKAFMPGNEHFQHWIDGGMFSMSLVYALHSLGVASCCLNWSQSPSIDRLLRSSVKIKPNHTVMMMIALGWPKENNKVCISARRPVNEVYSALQNQN